MATTKMAQDLFDVHSTNIVGGDYAYSYQHGNDVQTTQSITGDVTRR